MKNVMFIFCDVICYESVSLGSFSAKCRLAGFCLIFGVRTNSVAFMVKAPGHERKVCFASTIKIEQLQFFRLPPCYPLYIFSLFNSSRVSRTYVRT